MSISITNNHAPTPDAFLVFDDVTISYDDPLAGHITAVRSISLTVPPASFVSLLGPSGCGKTTLLKAAAGLLPCASGSIRFRKRLVTRPGMGIAIVPQAHNLFPWLTVEDNIAYGLQFRGLGKQANANIVSQLLDLVGLRDKRRSLPEALSGGMKQRVSLARTLAIDPELLCMDEPFGSLDTQTRSLMQELVTHIWTNSAKPVLFVTHDVAEAIYLSDKIFLSTAAPGTIRCTFDVGLDRPRDFRIRGSSGFQSLHQQIVEALREEVLRSPEWSGISDRYIPSQGSP